MSRKILMHVEATGKAKIEAEGFTEGECLDATSVFEKIFSKEDGPREMVGACAANNPDMGERVR